LYCCFGARCGDLARQSRSIGLDICLLRHHRPHAELDYRAQAPFAARNHPTEEHLMPLFVAMGAAGEAPSVERLHASYQYRVLAMDMYAFS